MTEQGSSVRFLCTDRETHPSRELGVLARLSTTDHELELVEVLPPELAGHVANQEALAQVNPRRRRGGHSPTSIPDGSTAVHTEGLNWRFRCPTCRRDIRLSHTDTVLLVDQLLAHGRTSVDMSALPPTIG